ncbi:MAG: bifunctional nuclease family protein [Acidimicrobiales bacterium]
MKLVDVLGLHVETTNGSLLLLLREHEEPHRVLPIVIGETEALAIALAIDGQAPPRPLTHDLMVSLVESLDARVGHAEVTELRDGAFVAELAVTGPQGERRIDSRPSDAIALAMRVDAPLFVSDDVLEQAGAVLPDEDSEQPDDVLGDDAPDDEVIDEEVGRFRAFLDDLDPADFTPPDEGTSTDD